MQVVVEHHLLVIIMKKLFLLIALFVVAIMPVEAKKEKVKPERKGLATINIAKAKSHVEFLASDILKGREAGTEWGHIAGEYLVAVLKQMGATPLFGNSFVQPFKGYSLYYSKASGYTVVPEGIEEIKKGPYRVANMHNILAKIEGKNPEEIVVVGAHYDHLGYDPMLADDCIYLLVQLVSLCRLLVDFLQLGVGKCVELVVTHCNSNFLQLSSNGFQTHFAKHFHNYQFLSYFL